MAAKINLLYRREPTDDKSAFIVWHQERRLGLIIFNRNGLHHRIRQPLLQQNNRCRIALECFRRKRINKMDCKFHQLSFIKSDALLKAEPYF